MLKIPLIKIGPEGIGVSKKNDGVVAHCMYYNYKFHAIEIDSGGSFEAIRIKIPQKKLITIVLRNFGCHNKFKGHFTVPYKINSATQSAEFICNLLNYLAKTNELYCDHRRISEVHPSKTTYGNIRIGLYEW